MPRFGKRSKERLEGVDPQIIKVLDELIKIMDVSIIEGKRTQERQDTLFKTGKSKRKVSKHTSGRAVDLAPYPLDWENNERFYYMSGMIRGIAHMMDIPIRVGGDWDSDGEIKDQQFNDLNHMELKGD